MDTLNVRVRVENSRFGQILRATSRIEKGEPIFFLDGMIVSQPSKYTIQLDAEEHILTTEHPWRLMNHGCEPNVLIDTGLREMVATRDILAGEELTFNYNSTEWSMVSSFACECGAPMCAGEVRGFKYLDAKHAEALRPFISPYIARRWAAAASRDEAGAAIDLRSLAPEVQVLVPYARDKHGQLTSPLYDTPEYRAELYGWFAPLGLKHKWTPVALDIVQEVVDNLQRRSRETTIVILNLCDGTENDLLPGKTVVRALEAAGLPFSGASETFYVTTTSKLATKHLLAASGVPHPASVEIEDPEVDLLRAAEEIDFPFIVKPDVSAGSFGIHIDSVCDDLEAARKAVARLREHPELGKGAVFVEPFVDGREFTCFLMEDEAAPLGLWTLPPVERVFDKRLPDRERFLAYERYWGLPEESRSIPEGDAYYRYALVSDNLQAEITRTARRAMRAVEGCSYARVDMRQDSRTGELLVLEVNSQCGLSCSDEATVGSILQLAGLNMSRLIERILVHALRRGQ